MPAPAAPARLTVHLLLTAFHFLLCCSPLRPLRDERGNLRGTSFSSLFTAGFTESENTALRARPTAAT
jgi:hypothetical protein